MHLRGLFAACAAVVLCASLVETAQAYPITARSGTTTVTGTYRPLDLSLVIVDGSTGFDLDNDGYGSLIVTMTGTYTGVGYPGPAPSGDAGSWRLSLFFDEEPATITGNVVSFGIPGWASTPYRVGTLRYLGGGDFGGLPYADTPQLNDTFRLFAEDDDEDVLEVTCSEDPSSCGAFTAKLLQSLSHVGPYIFDGEGYGDLDDGTACESYSMGTCVSFRPTRLNEVCTVDPLTGRVNPCGALLTENVVGSNAIPEPAGITLVGLGLLGLALTHRRRMPVRQPD